MARKTGSAQEFGHWFQDEVQAVLMQLMQKRKAVFHRIYDSGSTGGFLPAQPGDFHGTANGTPLLIEVKASKKYTSLCSSGALRSLVKPHQAAAQKLWDRAGASGLFIFHGDGTNEVELWPGAETAKVFATPRARLSAILADVHTYKSRDDLYKALERHLFPAE